MGEKGKVGRRRKPIAPMYSIQRRISARSPFRSPLMAHGQFSLAIAQRLLDGCWRLVWMVIWMAYEVPLQREPRQGTLGRMEPLACTSQPALEIQSLRSAYLKSCLQQARPLMHLMFGETLPYIMQLRIWDP